LGQISSASNQLFSRVSDTHYENVSSTVVSLNWLNWRFSNLKSSIFFETRLVKNKTVLTFRLPLTLISLIRWLKHCLVY